MLVVHPASTCDVCLDGYTADSENIPHSIACGHVFCLNCIRCLRNRSCPLCRSPFEEHDIRRLHLDRNGLPSNPERPAPPPQILQAFDLRDNSLGLYEPPTAEKLQRQIADMVFASIMIDGVRESQMQELLAELRHFLSTQSEDEHSALRSSYILLNRFTRLQKDHRILEGNMQRLRIENDREKQAVSDWERKNQDLQRSREYDQKVAAEIQERLLERLRFEDSEWQKKYDFVAEECRLLREELDDLRFLPKGRYGIPSPIKMPEPTVYLATTEERSRSAHCDKLKITNGAKDLELSSKDDNFINGVFRISPDALPVKLAEEKSFAADDISVQKLKQRSPELPFMSILDQDKAWCGDRSRPGSSSSSISRASENVTTAGIPVGRRLPAPTSVNRQRNGSIHSRSQSGEVARLAKEKGPEVSFSAPSSYESPLRSSAVATTSGRHEGRARSATTGDSSIRSSEPTPEVLRLYSLLEKPLPPTSQPLTGSLSASMAKNGSPPPRPVLARSSSAYQPHPTTSETSNAPLSASALSSSTNTRAVSDTFVQASAPLSSPSMQKPVDKRSVLPHLHSWYNSSRTPASPQEKSAGVSGTLPRRGSVSSASAAAALQAGSRDGSPAPHGNPNATSFSAPQTQAFVPPSALRFSHFVSRSSWEYQDSD